mmetsp:Transcript_131476/g.311734  ORF Transcript_131476/g.311734 Transcript_131476/m.311734 type:complete len:283 (+) Transcript_131476:3136-3984(+)
MIVLVLVLIQIPRVSDNVHAFAGESLWKTCLEAGHVHLEVFVDLQEHVGQVARHRLQVVRDLLQPRALRHMVVAEHGVGVPGLMFRAMVQVGRDETLQGLRSLVSHHFLNQHAAQVHVLLHQDVDDGLQNLAFHRWQVLDAEVLHEEVPQVALQSELQRLAAHDESQRVGDRDAHVPGSLPQKILLDLKDEVLQGQVSRGVAGDGHGLLHHGMEHFLDGAVHTRGQPHHQLGPAGPEDGELGGHVHHLRQRWGDEVVQAAGCPGPVHLHLSLVAVLPCSVGT